MRSMTSAYQVSGTGVSLGMAKEPTISGLKADLQAANSEARGYRDTVGRLREENKLLRDRLNTMQWQLQIVKAILFPTP